MMKKAQSTLEFAVVIVCTIAALLAMQVYIKRSMQGRLRASADSIGEQYAPGNTVLNSTYNLNTNTTSWSHVMQYVYNDTILDSETIGVTLPETIETRSVSETVKAP
jgi:hypothetical protein